MKLVKFSKMVLRMTSKNKGIMTVKTKARGLRRNPTNE